MIAPDPAAATEPAAPRGLLLGGSPAAVWGRRLLVAAVVVLAVGILVVTGRRAQTTLPEGTGHAAVVSQFPAPDGRALRQTEVGADLRDGYDGRLTINGIAIPEAQMEGVLDPTSPEAAEYEGSQLRPNNRNHVFFQPGPGKVIEKLPSGTIRVTLTYFRDLQPSVGRGTVTWTFEAE